MNILSVGLRILHFQRYTVDSSKHAHTDTLTKSCVKLCFVWNTFHTQQEKTWKTIQ